MNLSKKLLALLAIFCVIASATAVCAVDEGGYAGSNYVDDQGVSDDSQYDAGYDDVSYDEGGYAGSQYEDGGYAGSQYQDDGGWAGSQYNETLENATAANQTAQNATNSSSSVAANTTANATNTTNSTPIAALHNMLATGNPLLILFAAIAVVGGYAVLRRK